MNKILSFCCLLLVLHSVNGQNNSQKKFWDMVNARYTYNSMTPGMKSWFYEMAEKKTKSYTKALALLENLRNEVTFQDEIFLEIYLANYKSKEQIRLLLGNMCGSFSVGNPVADWVFEKYSKDSRAIAKINATKKRQELLKKIEAENDIRINDSLIETYKTRTFSNTELDEKVVAVNLTHIDSLFDEKIATLIAEKKIKQEGMFGVEPVYGINSIELIVDSNGKTVDILKDGIELFGFEREEVQQIKNDGLNFFNETKFTIPRYKNFAVKTSVFLDYNRQYIVGKNQFDVDSTGTIYWEYLTGSGTIYKRIELSKTNKAFNLLYENLKEKGKYSVNTLTSWINPQNKDEETESWTIAKVIRIYKKAKIN